MNKRRVLVRLGVGIVIVGVVIAALAYLLEYLSWKNVRFDLFSDTQSVIIYYGNGDKEHDSDLVEATRLTSSATIRLKTGSYTAVPSGEKVASSNIEFTVSGDSSVAVNPYYSDTYLATAFGSESTTIAAAITTKYPFVTANYTVEQGRFFHYGDWYATSLFTTTPAAGESVDIYGVLLHRIDGSWSVVETPTLVFTYADYASVPKDIVDSANQYLYDL